MKFLNNNTIQLNGFDYWLLKKLAYNLHFYISGIYSHVPLAHAANMKQFFENMKTRLAKIQYEKYNWNVSGDL